MQSWYPAAHFPLQVFVALPGGIFSHVSISLPAPFFPEGFTTEKRNLPFYARSPAGSSCISY